VIAHEVSNLLTPILGYAEAALSTDDHELQRKALTVTAKNVRMLVAMVERVLEISAAKPAEFEPVSVRAVAEDATASLCRDLSKDHIRLALKIDESLQVFADPLHLQQVLFNLFLNAREAMLAAGSGCLTVTAAQRGDQIIIEVCDTGMGIEPQALPDIFDPLKTSKPAEREGRQRCGGLGLALCRDLIEEGGGTISVASDPGVGTTFTIVLPAGDTANPSEKPLLAGSVPGDIP
jgi:signal transduction histidine kinase